MRLDRIRLGLFCSLRSGADAGSLGFGRAADADYPAWKPVDVAWDPAPTANCTVAPMVGAHYIASPRVINCAGLQSGDGVWGTWLGSAPYLMVRLRKLSQI